MGVWVWGVLRQEQHPCAASAQGSLGLGAFVNREIVEDDDIAALQRWRQLGLDIDIEGCTIHRAWDDPWRRQPIMAQACDECLGSPFAERGTGLEALALLCATP